MKTILVIAKITTSGKFISLTVTDNGYSVYMNLKNKYLALTLFKNLFTTFNPPIHFTIYRMDPAFKKPYSVTPCEWIDIKDLLNS